MTRVAVSVPSPDERRLVESAGHWGHEVVVACADGEDLARRIAADPPEVVLVAADPRHLAAPLVRACDDAGIRMVVVAAGEEGVRYAETLGVIDVHIGEPNWDALDLPAPASADTDGSRPPRMDPAPSRVIVVWGAAGAPGRTTVAIAIAAELAAAGRRVALADADTHAAAIAPTLGLLDEAPGFAAACRLAGGAGLDSAEFDRVAQRHPTGGGVLAVLTGLGRPSRWPELTVERVAGTLRAARSWVEITVVDVASNLDEDEEISSDVAAPRRNAATLAALRSADQVIAVASGDPVGLSRFLRAHIDLLEVVPAERIAVVANRIRSSAIGFDPAAQVAQTLRRLGGVESVVPIPEDRAAVDSAVLSGKTLVDAAPRSPMRIAIRDLLIPRLVGVDDVSAAGADRTESRVEAIGRRFRSKRVSRAARRRMDPAGERGGRAADRG